MQGLTSNGETKHNQKSLLYVAAEKRHKDVLKLLLKKGLDINASAYRWLVDYRTKLQRVSRTALQTASVKGASAVVEVLIEAGADISIRGDEGLTALHLAARH